MRRTVLLFPLLFPLLLSACSGSNPPEDNGIQPKTVGVPSGLTATGAVEAVALTWTAVPDATHYVLYRSTTAGGPYERAGSAHEPQYVDSGLQGDTTYYYVVSAAWLEDETEQSDEASATALRPAPGAVADLTATADDARVTLTWSSASHAAAYIVSRAAKVGGPWEELARVEQTTFVDTAVRNRSTYVYRVEAVTADGRVGGPAALAQATPYHSGRVYCVAAPELHDLQKYPAAASGEVTPLQSITGESHFGEATRIAVDPDTGDLFVIGENRISVFDAAERGAYVTAKRVLSLGYSTKLMAIDTDHDELYVVNLRDINVYPLDASGTVTPLRTIRVSKFIQDIAVDPDHEELFVLFDNGVATFDRLAQGNAAETRFLGGSNTDLSSARTLLYNPNRDELVISARAASDKSARLFTFAREAGNEQPLRYLRPVGLYGHSGMALAPDGDIIVTYDDTLAFFKATAASPNPSQTVPPHRLIGGSSETPYSQFLGISSPSVAVLPEGEGVAVGSYDAVGIFPLAGEEDAELIDVIGGTTNGLNYLTKVMYADGELLVPGEYPWRDKYADTLLSYDVAASGTALPQRIRSHYLYQIYVESIHKRIYAISDDSNLVAYSLDSSLTGEPLLSTEEDTLYQPPISRPLRLESTTYDAFNHELWLLLRDMLAVFNPDTLEVLRAMPFVDEFFGDQGTIAVSGATGEVYVYSGRERMGYVFDAALDSDGQWTRTFAGLASDLPHVSLSTDPVNNELLLAAEDQVWFFPLEHAGDIPLRVQRLPNDVRGVTMCE